MACAYRDGDTSGKLYDSNGNPCNVGMSTETKILVIVASSLIGLGLLSLAVFFVVRHRKNRAKRNRISTVPTRPMSAWGRPELLASQHRHSKMVSSTRQSRGVSTMAGSQAFIRDSSPDGFRGLLHQSSRQSMMSATTPPPDSPPAPHDHGRLSTYGPGSVVRPPSVTHQYKRTSFMDSPQARSQSTIAMPTPVAANNRNSMVFSNSTLPVLQFNTGAPMAAWRYSRTATGSPSFSEGLEEEELSTHTMPSAFHLFRSDSTTPTPSSELLTPRADMDEEILADAYEQEQVIPHNKRHSGYRVAGEMSFEDERILDDGTEMELRTWRFSRKPAHDQARPVSVAVARPVSLVTIDSNEYTAPSPAHQSPSYNAVRHAHVKSQEGDVDEVSFERDGRFHATSGLGLSMGESAHPGQLIGSAFGGEEGPEDRYSYYDDRRQSRRLEDGRP